MRQIADGIASEHAPITDPMVAFSDLEEGGERQYALMVKWDLTDEQADAGAGKERGDG